MLLKKLVLTSLQPVLNPIRWLFSLYKVVYLHCSLLLLFIRNSYYFLVMNFDVAATSLLGVHIHGEVAALILIWHKIHGACTTPPPPPPQGQGLIVTVQLCNTPNQSFGGREVEYTQLFNRYLASNCGLIFWPHFCEYKWPGMV